MDDTLLAWAEQLGRALVGRSLTVATAESCTGGLIGACITAVAGSSAYYRGGVVCYSDSAKVALAGVDPALLRRFGAVSEPAARAMAEGVRARLGADLAVSTTGIAGPTGGSEGKPVGLVFIALASSLGTTAEQHIFAGSRDAVRRQAAVSAMALVLNAPGLREGCPLRA